MILYEVVGKSAWDVESPEKRLGIYSTRDLAEKEMRKIQRVATSRGFMRSSIHIDEVVVDEMFE